jgi:hypothetical protein
MGRFCGFDRLQVAEINVESRTVSDCGKIPSIMAGLWAWVLH